MPWNKADHPIVRWANFSVDHLTQIADIELATLKIHLVVEDALRYLLASRLKLQPDGLTESRLEFSQLTELALAGLDNSHLLGAIRALNTARNSLSHSVESPKLQEQLEIFVREIGYMKEQKVSWPTASSDQLAALRSAFDDAVGEVFNVAVAVGGK